MSEDHLTINESMKQAVDSAPVDGVGDSRCYPGRLCNYLCVKRVHVKGIPEERTDPELCRPEQLPAEQRGAGYPHDGEKGDPESIGRRLWSFHNPSFEIERI